MRIMAANSRERLASVINSAQLATEIPSKLDCVRQLKQSLPQEDPVLLAEFLPYLFELQSDRFSPVRKFVTEMIGEIGLKSTEFLPEIVPVLITVLDDSTPAVARQAITCGIDLFRCTLETIAYQGLYSSELDSTLESAWEWMVKFKEKVYSMAFQPGSGGTRLLAIKFVEAVIRHYTPDPNGSSEPPPHEGKLVEFNISWLRRGHPVLNVKDLSIEASQSLGSLLEQLRFPTVKSLSNPMIIVLINSLSAIANERPAFYGRILPVLLGLEPSSSVVNGVNVSAAHHALRKAFNTCLKCTHPSAAPWRDRLASALKDMQTGGRAEKDIQQVCKNNGSIEEGKNDSLDTREEKASIKACNLVHSNLGRKRSGAEDEGDLPENEDTPGKRIRLTPSVSEESEKELDKNTIISQDDNGPVQQLVAMFGALVAQGEKAVGSLEILISSISADLLAEVVMANMHYLSPNSPKAEGNDESLHNITIIGSEQKAKYPPSFVAGVMSLSSTFPPIASLLDASACNDIVKSQEEEETATGADSAIVHTGMNGSENRAEIPGLDSFACTDGMSEALVASSLVSTDVEDASQEQVTSLGQSSQLNLVPSISTDRSEELSSKTAVMDVSSLVCSTATSVGLSTRLVLPKMTAPVVNLTDEEKDHLQKLAFGRIIEAYKQIAIAGGTQVRFSLLAYLGVEFPLELDPWKLLQKHILVDYTSHGGHELTLHVLYRLFGEAEEESDFFSSTTAASVYETFLLIVAEALKDSFPPSDKSLSRLLGEAPYLPKSVLKILDSMCSPGNSDKVEKESQSGDRVTQGLSAVWSLILLRPPIRDACLKIALQSAVHHLEEVRMKAIRLVANKLYPLSSIAKQIEDFAKEMLLLVISGDATEAKPAEGSITDSQKESDLERPSDEPRLMSGSRCMSLYFALCTKHSLFREIFIIYRSTSKVVKQGVHRHVPILVRTMGSSSDLLEIIADPPNGSENLLMQVLHTLTDGAIPSKELVYTIKKLYDSKVKEILIPILPFLAKDEVLQVFPYIVSLPLDKFQAALTRTLQGSSHTGPVLTPAEVLIAIHAIDPERDGIPLKKVTDACNACFEQRPIFTQQVLAKVLNQLVEQIPLPLLFMRTVLQAIGAFPTLVDFIMEILSRLVSKQIWKYPKLWVGFLKCAQLTKPQSFSVLLQLPPAQLENALNRSAALKAALKEPLIAHATQPSIQATLPRSVLVVLGIVPDSQTSSQAQTSQAPTGDTCNSDKEEVTEKLKESSNVS
ncbi:symplekin [Quillaja saponaria]|uniref:Symplekin n=1 Tax=Quillaja saponaria TaxID=32244 RepID=A0AAD7PNL6_QUISA|nr:symplekin [Quillaja saponaria]